MENKRILVISWFYPPVNSSEGIVTYKLLKNSGKKYTVFTQKNNTSWSYGASGEGLTASNIDVVYSSKDNLLEWKEDAIDFYVKNRSKYDVVMTRSMPPESHEVGLKIKEISPETTWIASFGDPISRNPYTLIARGSSSSNSLLMLDYVPIRILIKRFLLKPLHYFVHPLRNFRKIMNMRKEIRLQDSIMRKADLIIYNSEEQKEYMQGAREHGKFLILPHSYDLDLFPKSKINSEKKSKHITMSFLGHSDDIRSPMPLLQAIVKLRNEKPDLENKLEINFYGNLSDQCKIFIIDNSLYNIVKYKKNVSYIDSLKIMKSSEWLLHIDANLSCLLDKNIFFAAKLADYMGTQNKIFAVTMLNGTSADYLRQYNGVVCSHSPEDILNYLYLIIYKNYTKIVNRKYAEKFDAKIIARQFDCAVDKLLQKSNKNEL